MAQSVTYLFTHKELLDFGWAVIMKEDSRSEVKSSFGPLFFFPLPNRAQTSL